MLGWIMKICYLLDWEQEVEIIRQFINHIGPDLSSSLDADHPEKYAKNYRDLIRAYLKLKQESTAIFRIY